MNLASPHHRRALRYSLGITISSALAFGIDWPLSFLFPVLSAFFLALPLPRFTFKQGFLSMAVSLFAFLVGFIFTQFILPFPIIYVPLLALAIFNSYYHLNRSGSLWLTLMLLICLLLMPMLVGVHERLAIGVASVLVWSSWLTILLLWLVHYLVPDLPDESVKPAVKKFQPGYSAPAAELALKSTIVVFPLALLFIANNWVDQIVVLLFTAIYTLSPHLAKGKEAGINAIKSTLIGGLVAFFVYWALVAVPEYYFLILLMLLVSLIFGGVINSAKASAKYYPAAMVSMIVLMDSSLAEGANFTENFVVRLLFISMATLYVVVSLKVLDVYWPKSVLNKPVNV